MARAALGLLLLASALSACGGSDRETPSPSPTAAESVGPAPTGTPKPGTPTPAPTLVHPTPPATAPAAQIGLPAGFTAYAIATGFYRPTSIAVADDGIVYVSERHGKVKRLSDANGDGVFEASTVIMDTTGDITGLLAAPGGGLYVSKTGSVLLVSTGDGRGPMVVVSGLPHDRHQNNGLVIGPDGKLYLTNGSTCDDCAEAGALGDDPAAQS